MTTLMLSGIVCFMFLYMQENIVPEQQNQDEQSEQSEQNQQTQQLQEKSFDEHQAMKKRQNIALILVGVIGFTVVLVGFLQIRNLLHVPLPPSDKTKVVDAPADDAVVAVSEQDSAELKAQDTDEDGINDFEELYVYGTSAYLADSDSDGDSDYDEIMANEDPTCPKGQDCFGTTDIEADEEVKSANPASSPKQEILNITAAELRTLLTNSGQFTEDQINQFDDATLLQMYNETLSTNPSLMEETEPQDTQVGSETIEQTVSALEGLSAPEVRQMLISEGIEQSILDDLTDEQVMEVYEAALDQASSMAQ